MLFELLNRIRRSVLNDLHFYNARRCSNFIISLIVFFNLTIAELTYKTSSIALAFFPVDTL